jgi:hypothetical protein
MTRNFLSRILAPPYHRLKSIEINNLMQWSETEPSLPQDSHLRDLSEYIHGADQVTVLDTRLMVGALDPLIGCCSKLTSLRIATVGEYEPYIPGVNQDLLYQSSARLLRSVRSTLRSFYFEQGFSHNDYAAQKGYCRPRPRTNERSMDRLFVQWVLPVLLEASWPRMSRMELRGVGRLSWTLWLSNPPSLIDEPDSILKVTEHREKYGYEVQITRIAFPSRAKDDLQKLVGKATLIIEEEQLQDYEDISYGDCGIPEYDDFP